MAQLVRCLSRKQADLRFISRTHIKMPTMVAFTCNPGAEEAEMAEVAPQSSLTGLA